MNVKDVVGDANGAENQPVRVGDGLAHQVVEDNNNRGRGEVNAQRENDVANEQPRHAHKWRKEMETRFLLTQAVLRLQAELNVVPDGMPPVAETERTENNDQMKEHSNKEAENGDGAQDLNGNGPN